MSFKYSEIIVLRNESGYTSIYLFVVVARNSEIG